MYISFTNSWKILNVLFSLSFVLSKNPPAGRLREPLALTVTNLKDTRSPILIGVFRKDDPFAKKSFKNYLLNPAGVSAPTLSIEGLPYGEYAIALFQDRNGDEKLNTNLLGIPREPYGFSNNIRPKLSAPGYQECRFTYSENSNQLIINLIQ